MGLTTAIALAKRGFKSIRVLEQAPAADHHEPTRAFTFNLSTPSRNVFKDLGVEKLDTSGLKFEQLKFLNVGHDDKVKVKHFPRKGLYGKQLPRIMLMREELNQLLAQHIAQHHQEHIEVCLLYQLTSWTLRR